MYRDGNYDVIDGDENIFKIRCGQLTMCQKRPKSHLECLSMVHEDLHSC